ncbi:MAG: hypothetical protein OEL55_05160 [Desulfobulbaceae bacterium]|nr:hypothetical protein [Desulfobulbaceae bacterium]
MKKSKVIVLLTVIMLLVPISMIILSSVGEWKDLRVYKAPEGDLSLVVQTYVPVVNYFDSERQWVYIDRGGWNYPAQFSIQYTDDKEGWMDKCTVEWRETEVVFKTPDGYSMHLSKGYNPR